jgi:hypothetical protein
MSPDVFSKVARRMWGDDKFCALSAPPPNARDLWIFLLTGPQNTVIPGLFVKGELGLADDLDWDPEATRQCLQEIVDQGMVRVDRRRKLVWLPNAIQHNLPRSPKNVLGWATAWHILPECALRQEAATVIRAHLAAKNLKLAEAFDRVIRGEVSAADDAPEDDGPDGSPAGNQDAIQAGSKMPSKMASQEKEKKKEKDLSSSSPARAVGDSGPDHADPVAPAEPATAGPDAPNRAPAPQSPVLLPSRGSNGPSDAGPQPAVAATPEPDLLTMVAAIADAGNGFGHQMLDWAAQGKTFRTKQRETIRRVYAEYLEGQANAAQAAAIRADQAPPTPRSGHAAPFRAHAAALTYEAQEAQRRRMGHREPPPPPGVSRPAAGDAHTGGSRG